MAEKWEHMAIRSHYVSQDFVGNAVWMQLIRPDGTVDEHPEGASLIQHVRVLNDLGREGWQLVATEWESRAGADYRVAWLQRRIE